VGTDLGVVGLGDAEGVHGLDRDADGLEDLRRVGVRGGDVGGEAAALVEPVGLAELADDGVAGVHLLEDDLADFADLGGEGVAGLPVGFGEGLEVEGEGGAALEAEEVELAGLEDAGLDGLGVGALLRGGEFGEVVVPSFRCHAADVLDGAQGAVGAGGELAGECLAGAAEIGVVDLPLAGLVAVGGGDAAAGGTAGLLAEDGDAIVFPGEVEQAVGEVGDEGALVDGEAVDDLEAAFLQRLDLPPELARVGDDAAADGEVLDGGLDDAGGEEVELDAAGGVAGVGAAVDLQHDRDGLAAGGGAEFLDDFGDEAAFAFVAEADADVCDELAGDGCEGHGGRKARGWK